jgi:hypothetical protein
MRSLPWLISLAPLVAACAASAPPSDNPPASVRERLETEPTRLLMSSADSAGTITAELRDHTGWQSGLVDLQVSDGELVVSADASGALTVERFGLGLEPIAIPDSVFGNPAEMKNVRLALAEPAPIAAPVWSSDDDAVTASASVSLTLTWALAVDGSTIPLGSPSLPPVPVDLSLTGDGTIVHGEVRVQQQGELWSWADLVKLENLSLVLSASTL